MSTTKLSTITKNIGVTLKRHSPEIVTGIGIVGMATTTVMAVKATPKALMLIEEEKRRITYDAGELCKELPPSYIIRTAWKCYIPAAIMGTLSMFCLVGASSVSARRNAALATAYTLSETAIKEYRDKVVEVVGEKKEKVVRDAVAKDKIDNNPVSNKEIFITEKGSSLCYDVLSGRYFKSDIEILKKAVNETNSRLLNNTYMSLNDFYEAIGLSYTKVGYDLGWNIEKGLIEVNFSSQLATDGTPCLVLDYINAPQYNFDRWA